MAVAEMSSPAIAIPSRAGRAATRESSGQIAAWVPLVAVLLGIIGLFYLAQASDVTAMGYSIQELQVEEANWKLKNEQLRLELSRAKSLTVIEKEAATRLLMVPSKGNLYLKAPAPEQARRVSLSARGDSASPPLPEKASPATVEPLDSLRSSLASVLAPRAQLPAR